MSAIGLRSATEADAACLLAWRNDPLTRAASFNSAPVRPEEHSRWLRGRLDDPGCHLWIAEAGGEPVGQVRIERGREAAEISISVAPEKRGRGYAAAMILQAIAAFEGPDASGCVLARIKPDNAPSFAAFRRAGFREVGRDADAVRLCTTGGRTA